MIIDFEPLALFRLAQCVADLRKNRSREARRLSVVQEALVANVTNQMPSPPAEQPPRRLITPSSATATPGSSGCEDVDNRVRPTGLGPIASR